MRHAYDNLQTLPAHRRGSLAHNSPHPPAPPGRMAHKPSTIDHTIVQAPAHLMSVRGAGWFNGRAAGAERERHPSPCPAVLSDRSPSVFKAAAVYLTRQAPISASMRRGLPEAPASPSPASPHRSHPGSDAGQEHRVRPACRARWAGNQRLRRIRRKQLRPMGFPGFQTRLCRADCTSYRNLSQPALRPDNRPGLRYHAEYRPGRAW